MEEFGLPLSTLVAIGHMGVYVYVQMNGQIGVKGGISIFTFFYLFFFSKHYCYYM